MAATVAAAAVLSLAMLRGGWFVYQRVYSVFLIRNAAQTVGSIGSSEFPDAVSHWKPGIHPSHKPQEQSPLLYHHRRLQLHICMHDVPRLHGFCPVLDLSPSLCPIRSLFSMLHIVTMETKLALDQQCGNVSFLDFLSPFYPLSLCSHHISLHLAQNGCHLSLVSEPQLSGFNQSLVLLEHATESTLNEFPAGHVAHCGLKCNHALYRKSIEICHL